MSGAYSGYQYDKEVVFPFGHGLSYTTFQQTIKEYKVVDGKVQMVVNVKNTGTKAGKEVVQVYYKAPYTDAFDKANKIEKASKNLVEFAKTGMIAPGNEEDVTIEFLVEDMASYCYTHLNGDGTKDNPYTFPHCFLFYL